MQAMIAQIAGKLRAHEQVADWSLRRSELRSTQRYLIGTGTESRRRVERVAYPLLVFHDHPAPDGTPSRGSAQASILSDGSNLDSALEEALTMASLVNNRPYALPGPADYPGVPIADPDILERPLASADELLARLRAAVDGEPQVRLSSAELFLEERRVTLCNSRGVEAEALGTAVLLDFVLIAGQGAGEMEAHIAVERRRIQDIGVEALAARQAAYARDALRATATHAGRKTVLLRDEALVDLLGQAEGGVLAFHTSAGAKYHDMSLLQEGQPVTRGLPFSGDRLTYSGTRRLPFGLGSGPFDGEGLPAGEVAVIADGVMQRRWASQRYAEYLALPPTGAFGNAFVAPGQTALDDLLQETQLQIVSFSWMQPDAVTGDFVAEIRLGYERDGDAWRPVRGGSLSGNLFTALADVRLSRETAFFGGYQGPVAARFGALTLSGA